MTRTIASSKVSAVGLGATLTIPYTFPISVDTDLVGVQRDLFGVETALVLGTDYTVTGAGTSTGGTIVSVSAVTLGYTWVFRRVRALTQDVDLRNQGAYFLETIEDMADKLTDIAQQHGETLGRALVAAVTDTLSSYELPALTGMEGYALGVVSGPALGLVANNAVALAADLANTSVTTKGAGMVGYDSGTAYPVGTLGYALQSAAPSSYLTYAEDQAQTYRAFTAAGTAPAFTLTPSPVVSALAEPMGFEVKFAANGTTGSNTLNVSGLGAVALKQYDSAGSLVDGVIKSGQIAKVRYNGTYWVILNPLPAQAGQHGACIMVLSGASLVLKPWGGNGITINGVNYQIPSAGVSLAVTGMTAGTLYYIYAYMNSGTMTLEKSVTAHATGTDGVEIKSGDATRTLVGMARPVAGPAFSAAANCMLVRSWFNRTITERRPRSLQASEISRANGNYAEVGTTTRVEFLTWADETTSPSGLPCLKTTLSSSVAYAKLMIDGADLAYRSTFEQTTSSESYVYKIFGGSSTYGAASIPAAVSLERCPLILSEGYHYTSVQMHGNSVYLGADSAKSYGNTEIVIEKL